MKQKQQWAQDWYMENKALNMKGEGLFSSTESWIAGFDFAKRICGKHLGEWESVNDNSFDFVGEGEFTSSETK